MNTERIKAFAIPAIWVLCLCAMVEVWDRIFVVDQPQPNTSAQSPGWLRLGTFRARTFTNQFSGECYVVLMLDNDFSTLQIDRLTTNSNGYTISSNTLLPTIK